MALVIAEFRAYYMVGKPVNEANLANYLTWSYKTGGIESMLCDTEYGGFGCEDYRASVRKHGAFAGQLTILKITGHSPVSPTRLQVDVKVRRERGTAEEKLVVRRDGLIYSFAPVTFK